MGNIIAQVKTNFDTVVDSEASAFNKTILKGILRYVKILKEINDKGRVKSHRVKQKGNLYQEKDRTIFSDMRALINLVKIKRRKSEPR